MSWNGVFFAFVGFVVLIGFFASLAAGDYVSSVALGFLIAALPTLRKASRS